MGEVRVFEQMGEVMSKSAARSVVALFTGALIAAIASSASAQKKYDLGASDTEIKIGNTMPYSGPASAYSVVGKAEEAYLKKINDEGGINGRKIKFISYDDAYSPPKTVEQARRLVESDDVLFLFSPLGTPTSSAIHKYMNAKKVPMLFVASGASKWVDPKNFPWTIGLIPSYHSEAHIYALYLLKEKPDAKIAVLYQNDDFGKDFVRGLKEGLGDKTSMIVAERSYEVSEPTVDTHIVQLKSSGADVFLNFATTKFAAQGIRKSAEIGWNPLQIVPSVSSSMGSVIKPAGIENAQNVYSAAFSKDPSDPEWNDDPDMKRFYEFLSKYMPAANKSDSLIGIGHISAQVLVQVIKQCGDDLTRENVMRQATNLQDVSSDTLLPGIKVNSNASNFAPIKQMQMMRVKGNEWQLFGRLISTP
jgi:branched-chain amino acid transport system substrate-binding protein